MMPPRCSRLTFLFLIAGFVLGSNSCVVAAEAKSDLSAPDPVYDLDPAEVARNQHYAQPERPQFHYTPIQGHIGDATGLIFYQGEYHLFYMSDKWERRRNRHKCWGHAISRDLVHWEEMPSVLDPVLDHKPGSGSGLVDWNNALKLQSGPEKTLAIFYTDYVIGSCLAYSNDAGRTWIRHPGNPFCAGTHEIRDPKVFWYEPAREWRMVRYEDKAFVFQGSADLFHWRELSRVAGFYECPDLFELAVDGATTQRKWVLCGADGGYMLGSFDGSAFQPETGMLHTELNGPGSFYAPQTWTNPSDQGSSITQIGFLHYPKGSRLTWENQMCFPATLTLRTTADGVRLFREPSPSLALLRVETKEWKDLTLRKDENPLAEVRGDVLEIRAEIDLGTATAITLGVRGQSIRLAADGQCNMAGVKKSYAPENHHLTVQLLADRSSLELFFDHGRASISKCIFFDPANQSFSLASEGGESHVLSLEVNHLKSVWREKLPTTSPAVSSPTQPVSKDTRKAENATIADASPATGQVLYNGIQLPAAWPPRVSQRGDKVLPVPPYLEHPPALIPIDVGRQLFVDDFLIEKTDLHRQFHYPKRYEGNPILIPGTPTELGEFAEKEKDGNTKPTAAMISDGFCYDSKEKVFKLWYQAGWRDGTNIAESQDGLHWTRLETDLEKGNNRVIPKLANHASRHGTGISFDPFTIDLAQRYKMLLYDENKTHAYISPDGIHWNLQGDVTECGDNATAFYNPFRQKWVISIRVSHSVRNGRARDYREHADFLQAIHWSPLPERASEFASSHSEQYEWAGTDPLDLPDPAMLARIPAESKTDPKVRGLYGDPPQLYNVDAVAYESIMVGMFGILRGPTSGKVWDELKCAKRNDLHLAYSRDGFSWDRPDRTPFLACTRHEGDWENGYLHSGVGVMCVVHDQLYFYYSGWSGAGPKGPTTYAGGSTGVAMLRRDGFASMDSGPDAAGTLTTRPLTFKGQYLFVNVDAPKGELKAEVLDESGNLISPFSADRCAAYTGNSTHQQITWQGTSDLSALSGRKVRLRFTLRNGAFYSFWVSPNRSGASHGYVGAGGPAFDGLIDTTGEGKAP